jgi:myo-inositol-1(or 4)-monophosphatase
MADALDQHLAAIKEIATQAGAILLQYFEREELHETTKLTAADILTDADLASDKYIREQFRVRFPDFGVITEEGATIQPANPGPDELWLCADPLDGTTNFSCNLPHFAVSIGILNHQHVSLAGCVYDPTRREIFSAAVGRGAWLESPSGRRQLKVRANTELVKCLVSTGFHVTHLTSSDNNLREVAEILPKVRCLRRIGSAALDIVYVAAARLDAYWERGIHIWDIAAGVVIASEAGCVLTDYSGRSFSAETFQVPMLTIVCANPVIQPILRECIQRARAGLPAE